MVVLIKTMFYVKIRIYCCLNVQVLYLNSSWLLMLTFPSRNLSIDHLNRSFWGRGVTI